MKTKTNIAFNTGEDGIIKIIKLDEDNKIYSIDKQVAFVFKQISENKAYNEILVELAVLEAKKTKDELSKFLDSVIEDFKKLGFIE